MGKRKLPVTVGLLVAMLMGPGEVARTFTVKNPLPSDTRVVHGSVVWEGDVIQLVLESEEWEGEDGPIALPMAQVHYGSMEVTPCGPPLN